MSASFSLFAKLGYCFTHVQGNVIEMSIYCPFSFKDYRIYVFHLVNIFKAFNLAAEFLGHFMKGIINQIFTFSLYDVMLWRRCTAIGIVWDIFELSSSSRNFTPELSIFFTGFFFPKSLSKKTISCSYYTGYYHTADYLFLQYRFSGNFDISCAWGNV